jgi:Tfp pilus assembly protein PilF
MRLFQFLLTLSILAGATWFASPQIESSRAQVSSTQSTFEKREAAYRANNIGVALLEQYKTKDAVDSFTRALETKPDLLIARINLAIALYYLPDAEAARREAEKALKLDASAPQPHYIQGLIARTQNRFDDAVAEFQIVLKTDPSDAGTNVNLGQIFVQQKKQPEAIAAFRKTIESEPYNETALYNLGLLLTRTGKREEGQQLMQRFQQVKASGAGIALGTNYLEGGHYAEAVVSTGAEEGLVERVLPEVKSVEESSRFPTQVGSSPERQPPGGSISRGWEADSRNLVAGHYRTSPLLFDLDNDGDLDLLQLDENALRLLRNDGASFSDVTRNAGAIGAGAYEAPITSVAGDYDNDGRADLLVVRYGSISLYHNDGDSKFSDATKGAGIPNYPYLAISVAFVDVDHDGDLDIFIPGFADLRKLKIEPILGKASPLPGRVKPDPNSDLFQLVGDLPGAPNVLLRNNGNRTFTDVSANAGVGGAGGHAVGVVPTDFDNRRDIDLLVINYGGTADLFRNQRDGSFKNVGREAGLNKNAKWSCGAAGDVNKDGFTDFFFGRADGPGEFALSDGKTHFRTSPAPAETSGATTAQFVDYDNDGLLDLITVAWSGAHLWRNFGDSWGDATKQALNVRFSDGIANDSILLRPLATADVDADGDVDVVLQMSSDKLIFLRNDGGNRNRSVKVDLHGKVSNRIAIGAKVELRAGSLYHKLETYSASPAPAPADLIFGLGKRERPDAVRVIWPAGILQAETEFPQTSALMKLNITELDRKPSSCPYLYTWNGERFEFITDFMGGGEMGYLEAPATWSITGAAAMRSVPGAVATGSTPPRYNQPDPVEYVRIRNDQLKEKDGRYELRVTNELEEAMFVDRLQLLAVAHPAGTDVYPNEGMSAPPKPYKLFMTQNAQLPLSAVDDKGTDVLDLISRMDRRWPDDFEVDQIRGYAAGHSLTLKLSDSISARRSLAEERKGAGTERRSLSAHRGGRAATEKRSSNEVLLLTGWTDYAWSSDNVAAAQAGKAMKLPSLQVKDRAGKWRTVIEDIGIPVGRPQTVTVDLTGKFLSASREVRIVTNMRIYWDQIRSATLTEERAAQITRLDPVRADLRWRGFSAEVTPDGAQPFGYDYHRVSFASPWKVMAGRYTREGDVRELLASSDDMFVVSRTGDEIALSFDASSLPALPDGWTRTFLLYADGFSKEMDINSASPDQLAPMPFHAMTRYPYSRPEHYPSDARHLEYLEKYNTRLVRSQVPLIDAAILGR